MEKHTRFHIDLHPDDTKLLDRLAVHLSQKREGIVIRAEVVRTAIRALAKKEKVG